MVQASLKLFLEHQCHPREVFLRAVLDVSQGAFLETFLKTFLEACLGALLGAFIKVFLKAPQAHS